MAGHLSGVRQRSRELYPEAASVHCDSHKLNLVVNDLNDVVAVWNTVGTVKSIIRFFRGSATLV